MHEVGIPRGAAGCSPEGSQHQRQQQRPRRPAPKIPDDTRPVRNPVMAEADGRDDLDVDAAPANVLDRVGDEAAGGVPRRPRVRGREDGDLHTTVCRRRPKTTGKASTSRMNA